MLETEVFTSYWHRIIPLIRLQELILAEPVWKYCKQLQIGIKFTAGWVIIHRRRGGEVHLDCRMDWIWVSIRGRWSHQATSIQCLQTESSQPKRSDISCRQSLSQKNLSSTKSSQSNRFPSVLVLCLNTTNTGEIQHKSPSKRKKKPMENNEFNQF